MSCSTQFLQLPSITLSSSNSNDSCCIDPFTGLSLDPGDVNFTPGDALELTTGDVLNVLYDNTTIGLDGFNRLELINPYIDFVGGDGVNVSLSQVPLGGSLTIDVDNTVVRTTGDFTLDGVITLSNITNSTSPTTGSLIVVGGVGIQQDLHIGGEATGTAFNAISDRRFKTGIQILNPVESLKKLHEIKPCSYKWKRTKMTPNCNLEELNYGVIAQEIEEIGLEFMVKKVKKKYKAVNYTQLIPLMISAMQEMSREIDELKHTIRKEK